MVPSTWPTIGWSSSGICPQSTIIKGIDFCGQRVVASFSLHFFGQSLKSLSVIITTVSPSNISEVASSSSPSAVCPSILMEASDKTYSNKGHTEQMGSKPTRSDTLPTRQQNETSSSPRSEYQKETRSVSRETNVISSYKSYIIHVSQCKPQIHA